MLKLFTYNCRLCLKWIQLLFLFPQILRFPCSLVAQFPSLVRFGRKNRASSAARGWDPGGFAAGDVLGHGPGGPEVKRAWCHGAWSSWVAVCFVCVLFYFVKTAYIDAFAN